jgi:hypothetical protein
MAKPVDPKAQGVVRRADAAVSAQLRNQMRQRLVGMGYTTPEANALIRDGLALGQVRREVHADINGRAKAGRP